VSKWKKLGDCTVPHGKRGAWEISTLIKEKEFEGLGLLGLLRTMRDNPETYVPPGTYKRLVNRQRATVVMSNTPFEVRTNYEAQRDAKGHVLINGLGMGMLLEALLHKEGVTLITVVEFSDDLIHLVGPHYRKLAGEKGVELEIVHDNAFLFQPRRVYDYVWHDIWDNISPENLPDMADLNRKYGKFAHKQGTWTRDYLRRKMRQDEQTMEDIKRWYADEIAANKRRQSEKPGR
jgi:hypothetical protein